MSAAFICVVLFFVITSESAPTITQEICACKSDPNSLEVDELFNFLNEIEKDTVDYPILPGILSPTVLCSDCSEIGRKKRKALPDTNTEVTEKISEDLTEKDEDMAVKVRKTETPRARVTADKGVQVDSTG